MRLATFVLLCVSVPSTLIAQTVANVYVSTTSGIYGFATSSSGAVQSIAGSPFAGPSFSVAASKSHAYASDGKNIGTYSRAASGALHLTSTIDGTQHNDTPTGSGVGALTLDRSGATLYAGEYSFQGADNNAYAEFGTTATSLAFKANTGINVDDGPGLEFSGSNRFAYGIGCYFANWDLFGFVRASTGVLSPIATGDAFPGDLDPNGTYCPSGISADGHGYLTVSFTNLDAGYEAFLANFQITGSGDVLYVPGSTLDLGSKGGVGPRFDPSGKYLAVAYPAGVALYTTDANHHFVKLQNPIATNLSFRDYAWDKSGHLYAVTNSAFYVFTLKSGKLTWKGSATQQLPQKSVGSLSVVPLV